MDIEFGTTRKITRNQSAVTIYRRTGKDFPHDREAIGEIKGTRLYDKLRADSFFRWSVRLGTEHLAHGGTWPTIARARLAALEAARKLP